VSFRGGGGAPPEVGTTVTTGLYVRAEKSTLRYYRYGVGKWGTVCLGKQTELLSPSVFIVAFHVP
jgi:hypothetical protein